MDNINHDDARDIRLDRDRAIGADRPAGSQVRPPDRQRGGAISGCHRTIETRITLMTKSLWEQLCADARFYRRLKRPGKPETAAATLTVALTSKGWWLLVFHRIIFFSSSCRNLKSPLWWLTRLLEPPASYLNAVLNKSEILGDCEIPDSVYLSDNGYLMFGAKLVGAGTIIHDHVTAGYAVALGKADRPTIGRNVWIGPNCVIAGDLHVGDGSTLLPGTVLTYSIPPGSVVRGSPAQIVRKDFDNTSLRQSLEMAPEHLSRKS